MFPLLPRSEGKLFCSDDLRQILEGVHRKAVSEIEGIEQNRFLNTSVEDLARYLIDRYSIDAPSLGLEQWSVSDSETKIELRGPGISGLYENGRPVVIPGQRIEIWIPVVGSTDLLFARPSSTLMRVPAGRLEQGTLVLRFEVPNGDNRDLRQELDDEVSIIQRYLGWIRDDLAVFAAEFETVVRSAIDSRRSRILEHRGRIANLGIPVRPRPSAPQTYALPTIRKKALVKLPEAPSGQYELEPSLDWATYDEILKVLDNMTLVMEQSPSAFRNMGEEDLRQHYLVQLNGQFEGGATAETFSVNGKTDILLKHNGRTAFIAECKFWKGPKKFGETIDQLLGYLSWRDTKAAILLFCRNQSPSVVSEGVVTVTKGHQNFKRQMEWAHQSGYRFVLHQPQDKNRELILSVLVYHVPSQ